MTIPSELENVLARDPDVMHGALCFRGTRVSVKVFLGEISESMGLDEFIENYPNVSCEGSVAVPRWLARVGGERLGLV